MKAFRLILGSLFLIGGGILLSMLASTLMGGDNAAGDFLWKSYSYAAFGAPLLCFWIFAVLAFGGPQVYRLVGPLLFVLPLLAFGVGFRIMFWQPPAALPPFWNTVELFGKAAAVVFWFFAGSVLTVSIAFLQAVLAGARQSVQADDADGFGKISSALAENYSRVKTILAGSQPAAPAYAPSTKPEMPYDAMDTATHARNHTGYKYMPDSYMTPAEHDRYLLIFNREKLREPASRTIHREFESETIQDAVPLGAEGYARIAGNDPARPSVYAEPRHAAAVVAPVASKGAAGLAVAASQSSPAGAWAADLANSDEAYRVLKASDAESPRHSAVSYAAHGNTAPAYALDEFDDDADDAADDLSLAAYDEAAREKHAGFETDSDLEERKKKLLLNRSFSSTESHNVAGSVAGPSFDYDEEDDLDDGYGPEYGSAPSASGEFEADYEEDVDDMYAEDDAPAPRRVDDRGAQFVESALGEPPALYERGAITAENPVYAPASVDAAAQIARGAGNAAVSPEPSPEISREPSLSDDEINEARLKPARSKKRKLKYNIPIHGLLDAPSEEGRVDVAGIKRVIQKLEETLQEFGIDAKVVTYCRGPVVTVFEILPAPGVRLNRIVALSDNIALRLAAASIRIVAPIPGKEAVGIEVPNETRDVVSLSELISHKKFHNKETALPVALGKDVEANVRIADLSRMPHLLIAGATGSGKSVCVNTILCSLLFRCSPDELRFLLIDPKTVELNFYNGIAHLLTPVIDSPERVVQALRWCVEEMERRYRLLGAHGVREIRSYNAKLAAQNVAKGAHMPYIVIVIDEFADLMLTCGKEIETLVSRIAAKSRAVGMHLVLATQRPSTDVITGIIKANIPSRIAFMVASKTDSRIILDQNGADKLLGRGDMLFSSANDLSPVRIQGAFLSEEEVARVVEQVKVIGGEPDYLDEDELFPRHDDGDDSYDSLEDPLWDEAVSEVRGSNKASASYLQRRFRIGYNRAARLIDAMEDQGIIGPQQGSKPRSVFAE